MSSDLPDNIDELIQIEEQGDQLRFFAPRLHWYESDENPASFGATNYCPSLEWIQVSQKPAGISKEVIAAERKRILGLKKYFRTCSQCHRTDCSDRFNTSKSICDACAENNGDVCF